MTGTKQVTDETFLRHLPYSVIKRLCVLLDTDGLWMKLVCHIPKKLDGPLFEERYTQQQIRHFEENGRKVGGSSTGSVLNDWFTQNARVKHLIKALSDSQLYAAADYLSVDVLKGEKVPRPQSDYDNSVIGATSHPKPPGLKEQNLDKSCRMEKSDLYQDKLTPYKLPDKLDPSLKPPKRKPHPTESVDQYQTNRTSVGDIVKVDRTILLESGIPSPDLRSFPNFSHCFQSAQSDEHSVSPSSGPGEEEKATSEKSEISPGSQAINFNTLRHYTDNFNTKEVSEGGNVIGCGGFGTVFLGVFPNGYKVAVKVLKNADDLTQKQFETELNSLTKFRHKNIVLLLGYSVDGPNKCLVYEYMINGSLEDRLCCFDGTQPLFWKLRVQISKGTARGISYLNGRGVVHRDIKSANVLLDEDFTPKVGDFATVRSAPSGAGSTVAETALVIGTSAYMAPEAVRFDISAKLDSFAFGVVLLELLTGLPPNDTRREEADLWSYVQENCDDDDENIDDLLDKQAGEWDPKVAASLFTIAKKCLFDKKKTRALVADILPELERLL